MNVWNWREAASRLLDEAGEGPQTRHQPRLLLLLLEDLDDKPIAELGMLRPPGIGDALVGKPGVELWSVFTFGRGRNSGSRIVPV